MNQAHRQALPGYSRMTCVGCGRQSLRALINKIGGSYLSCESCRFRVLTASLELIGAMDFFGRCLGDPEFRQQWLRAQFQAREEQLKALPPVAVPGFTKTPVERTDGVVA